MENLGDIDVQSIAGAISTATHGTGARLANISSQVAELKMVLADGSTLVCSPERDPELFRAARVGLGALGVIVEVTLRCVPAFTLRGVDAPAPLAQTLERFEELALGNDHSSSSSSPTRAPLSPAPTTAARKPRVRAGAPRPTSTTSSSPITPSSCSAAPASFSRPDPAPERARDHAGGRSERLESSAAIFASPRLVRFTEMEYALPREHTPQAVRAVMQMIERRGFAVPFPDRGPDGRARRCAPEHRRGARERLHRRAHVSRHGLGAILPRRGGDHGRAGRTPALGQAPLPDGRHATPPLPALGSLPGLFVRAWTPTGASPTSGPIASSARSSRRARAPRPRAGRAEHGRPRPRTPGTRHRGAAGAVRADRPRCDLGQRGRHGTPRRRQADPPGQQVAAMPRVAGARARRARAFGAPSPSRCPRPCGWPPTA